MVYRYYCKRVVTHHFWLQLLLQLSLSIYQYLLQMSRSPMTRSHHVCFNMFTNSSGHRHHNDTVKNIVQLWDLELLVGSDKLVKAVTDCKSYHRQLCPEHPVPPHIFLQRLHHASDENLRWLNLQCPNAQSRPKWLFHKELMQSCAFPWKRPRGPLICSRWFH